MIKKLLDKIFKPRNKKTEHTKPPRNQSENSSQHSKTGRPILGTKKTAKKSHLNRDKAEIIPLKKHHIDRNLLSSAALRTIDGLQKAGFEAYIVGGAVRDLLLNRSPKDFDVATDATPEEVNRIFRRSRIIGRRFRLVHVLFGDETIEVSTFRGHHQSEGDAHTNESGRITRDNVFGSLE